MDDRHAVRRRRSTYGAYLAHGLWREGCGSKDVDEWCFDCLEIYADVVNDPRTAVEDTFSRVAQRYDMRIPRPGSHLSSMRSSYRRRRR